MKPLALLALLATLSPAVAIAGKRAVGDKPRQGENPNRRYESSQWFHLEVKFGPYSPDIDSSAGLSGNKPFADLFNRQGNRDRPARRLLTNVEFDVQVFNKFGQNLGVGVSWGWQRRSTHSFEYSDPVAMSSCTPALGNCTRSGDTTTLNVMPFELLLVYRFDLLADRYRVPLVPYFKIGLGYALWWIENGAGDVPQIAGTDFKGRGGSFGWTLKPGIALRLDVLDPTAARVIDSEIGINHTYLFCELNYMSYDGFGASDKLNLSDTTLSAGISFEF